jgi:tight adherence protein B
MRTVLIIASGCCFGLGTAGIAVAWHAGGPRPEGIVRRLMTKQLRGHLVLLVAAASSGAVAYWVTGWPVFGIVAAVGTYGLPRLFARTSGEVSITKIEAIAAWTEMLQSTLAASSGLSQAIVATAPLSPLPIREPAARLSSRLSAGMHPHDALGQFAEEVGDPCADRVVCALQLVASSRAQRIGDLLSALADSTREEVALRLRIETSRAGIRGGVRTVLGFSVVFAACLVFFAHAYLAPFDSGEGQLVLAAVATLYATGLTLMVALARPPAPVRLLGQQVIEG